MKLTIIIVNYNVKHFVEQCLYSVINANKQITTEIFVVDNNSVDGSCALIKEKFPEVKVIENKENLGFSRANNQAIRLSKGEFILLLNPDTVVQEDTFEKVIAFMDEHPEAGGLGVKMLDGKGNFLPESKRGLPTPAVAFYKIFGLSRLFPRSRKFGRYHLGFLDKDKIHEVDVLSGAFMLLRKATLDKIGLLDEAFFMYGEDIDLSYRIILAGYKNYYFPETRIIHYKGESTKKSSVNYVFVFYKAMVIFARKHFSQRNAKTFSILINVAIYLRAAMAIMFRFIKRLVLPALDFLIILILLILTKNYYEKEVIFKTDNGTYDEKLVTIAFVIYTLIWQFFVYLSGGYDKPVKLLKLIRGIAVGTAVILIGYSLLPEAYRFSRALILLGSAIAITELLFTRITFHFASLKGFTLQKEKSKRIIIVGEKDEYIRVKELLNHSQVNIGFLGSIATEDHSKTIPDYLGSINSLEDAIRIHNVNEVIFCSRNMSSKEIIDFMLRLVSAEVDFKIAPPESISIIGSNSIDTAGDLYVIDTNSILKASNQRNKQLIDISLSLLFILLFPLFIWFPEKKSRFIRNSFLCLFGIRSWVGYSSYQYSGLPKIKSSVLSPIDGVKDKLGDDQIKRKLLIYSKDYKPENDLKIVFNNLRLLGN